MEHFNLSYIHSELLSSGLKQKAVLLRLESVEQDRCYYTCLQSWPNLGDPPLDFLLENLKQGIYQEGLVLNALQRGLSYGSLHIKPGTLAPQVSSHFLATSEEIFSPDLMVKMLEGEFQSLKKKLHVPSSELNLSLLNLEADYMRLDPPWTLRLDFNAHYKRKEVMEALSNLSKEFLERVDWIEDPFIGSEEEMRGLFEEFGVPYAMDWDWHLREPKSSVGFVLVLKPARDLQRIREREFLSYSRILVTSYLSHPLEQLLTQREAEELGKLHPGVEGAYCHNDFYDSCPSYSCVMQVKNSKIPWACYEAVRSLLEKENWQGLAKSIPRSRIFPEEPR